MRRADRSSRGVLPSVVPPVRATVRHRKGRTWPGIGPNYHRKEKYLFHKLLSLSANYSVIYAKNSTENFGFISSVM